MCSALHPFSNYFDAVREGPRECVADLLVDLESGLDVDSGRNYYLGADLAQVTDEECAWR